MENTNQEIIKSFSDERIVKLINGYKKQLERNKIWNKKNPENLNESSKRYYQKIKTENPKKYNKI